MEAFSLAIAFLVIFFTIGFFAFRNDASNVDANLPPGGSGWPIVGETLDFFINPEKFLSDRMKRHSPDIFRTNFFGEKFVIICGSSGHKFLFSNEDKHFTAYLLKSMQKLFFSTQRNTDKGLSNDGMKMPQFLAFILKPEALVKYVAGSSKQAKFSGKKSSYSVMWCYSSRPEESRSGSLVTLSGATVQTGGIPTLRRAWPIRIVQKFYKKIEWAYVEINGIRRVQIADPSTPFFADPNTPFLADPSTKIECLDRPPTHVGCRLFQQCSWRGIGIPIGILGMDSIIQKQLKTHFEGKAEVKIYPFSRSITLTIACRFFLGIENPERIAKLVSQFNKVTHGLHTLPLNVPGTAFYHAIKATGVIRKELSDVIAEKRAQVASGAPTQDICTAMIVEGMSDEDICEKITGLLVAGYSTIASTITFFMKFVGERSDVYHKILSEQLEISKSKQPEEHLCWDDMHKMKYSWAVVCEAIRMVPPVLGNFREAKTDFSYAGFTVPKGWKVFWTVNTTQKNPEYFREPCKFDPSRFMEGEGLPPYTFVPFGGGPRMCPGREYARFVILAFVHNVVKKFRWEMVDPNEKVVGSMMPLPEKGLPVHLHPRYV